MLANNSRSLQHWTEPSLQTYVCNFCPKQTWCGKTVTGHVPLSLRDPRITLPTLSEPDLSCFANHVPFWQTKTPYKILYIHAPELRIIVSSGCCQSQDLLSFASWSLSDENVCFFVLLCQTGNGHFKICKHPRWLYSWPCVWAVLCPRPHGDQGWGSNQIQASWLTALNPLQGLPALIPWGQPKQSTHISISNQCVFPSLAILTLVRTSSSRLNASGESEHPGESI